MKMECWPITMNHKSNPLRESRFTTTHARVTPVDFFWDDSPSIFWGREVDHLLFHSCIQAMIWMWDGKSLLLSFCILRPTPNNEMTVFCSPDTSNRFKWTHTRDIVCALLHIHFIAYFEQACLILDIVTFVSNSLNIYGSIFQDSYSA